jgi:uroporphyrinogen-III synthase
MNLFISRKLSQDSLFHSCVNQGIDIYDESLIDFTAIPFTKPETNWIFFYSKKGIDFYFENLDLDTSQNYAVLGSATASYFNLKTNHFVDFIGNNNGEQIAERLKKTINGDSITFIKAKNSIESVETYFVESDNHKALAIYENRIKKVEAIKSMEIPSCDIVVLTSPMNAKAWFDYKSYTNEKVIAIGKTTAFKIKTIINREVPYCKHPSENALYYLVKENL